MVSGLIVATIKLSISKVAFTLPFTASKEAKFSMIKSSKHWINIVAALVLIAVSVCYIAYFHFLNFVISVSSSSSDRALAFDYRVIEKQMCANNKPKYCDPCKLIEDRSGHLANKPAFKRNLLLVKEEIDRQKNDPNDPIKIIFLGDSITLNWNHQLSGEYDSILDAHFKTRALALGINGDTVSEDKLSSQYLYLLRQ